MSLTLALNNALSGLRVNQQALTLTSHNLANANTEGYSRQQLDTSADYVVGQVNGVIVEGVVRRVDTYLQNSIREYSSQTGRTSVISEYMDRMQIMLGEPNQANSIDEYTESFFNSLQALAETPERASYREQAVNSGAILAREVSSLASDLEYMRYELDRNIYNTVENVNNIVATISATNIAINNAKALGNPTAGLEDERDGLLEDLSEQMEIRSYILDTGEVHVYTNDGISLLDDTPYSLSYEPASSVEVFSGDKELNPLRVVIRDNNGQIINQQKDLISAGVDGGDITSVLGQGRLAGLQEMRDTFIPSVLQQLDELASTIRDTFNAIHNDGSSYPGAEELTGERVISGTDKTEWSGGIMIAALQNDGTPAPSRYSDELHTGTRPLHLNLETLDSGEGKGYVATQTIIDEINNHFGPAPVKTSLGNINNIQIVSDVAAMPDAPPIFSFDFDLENISNLSADFFMTGITVLDDGGVDITSVNTPPPQIALDNTNTFTTTIGSGVVTVASANHTLSEGQRIYISDPGVAVNGILGTSFDGYYEVTNVTATGFDIGIKNAVATSTGSVNVATQNAILKTDTIDAGDKRRTLDQSIVELDLSGNAGSTYYDITLDVGVDDGQGTADEILTSKVTYRIYNNAKSLLNERYNSSAETGAGDRLVARTTESYIRAIMVDENGLEIPKTPEGDYKAGFQGFLKLVASDGYNIVIDQQNSKQLGTLVNAPLAEGTNRAFSHYFGLNNFFTNNGQTATGEVLTGSAINLAVGERLTDNSNLISLGDLTASNQLAGEDAKPIYTYERYIADNSVIQRLAKLGIENMSFDEAGGMGKSTQKINGWIGEFLAFNSAAAVKAESDNKNSDILLQGFVERSDNFSGVNVDEELANTVIYQQAYTSSARIISVADEMFSALLAAF